MGLRFFKQRKSFYSSCHSSHGENHSFLLAVYHFRSLLFDEIISARKKHPLLLLAVCDLRSFETKKYLMIYHFRPSKTKSLSFAFFANKTHKNQPLSSSSDTT